MNGGSALHGVLPETPPPKYVYDPHMTLARNGF